MRRLCPPLAGIDPTRAAALSRARVVAWRDRCRGPGRVARFSLVRCTEALLTPDAPDTAWWEEPDSTTVSLDQGQRIDIVLRLLADHGGERLVALWSRAGPVALAQSDLGWWAAVLHAAADRQVEAPSVLVVTRWGWRCLPEDVSCSWSRPRHAPRPATRP